MDDCIAVVVYSWLGCFLVSWWTGSAVAGVGGVGSTVGGLGQLLTPASFVGGGVGHTVLVMVCPRSSPACGVGRC